MPSPKKTRQRKGRPRRETQEKSDASPAVQRTEVENVLHPSGGVFHTLVQDLPIGLLVLDGAGYVRICNRFALNLFRTTEARILNRSYREMRWKTMHEDGSDMTLDETPIAQALQTGRPLTDVVVGIRGIATKTVWLLVQVAPKENTGGDIDSLVITLNDITSLRETRQALARSRERLGELSRLHREILNSAFEGIIVYDHDLRYRLWSHSMEELTGIKSSQVVGRMATDVFPHLNELGLVDLIKQTLNGTPSVSPDFEFKNASGAMRWISSTYSPHRDASGKVIGVIAMVRDITKRKIAEMAYIESQKLVTTIAESTPDILYVYDLAKKNLTYTNKSLAHYLGYHDAVKVEDVEITPARAWSDGTGDEMVASESRFRDKDGRLRWFVSREKIFSKNNDGSPREIIGSMREITDQKIQELELRESESHYRSIFESTTDGLFIVDRIGRIRDANPPGCTMHGYEFDDIYNRPLKLLLHRPDEDFFDRLFNAAEKGVSFVSEGTNIRKDGSLFSVEIRGSRFHSADETLYLVVTTDISERKQVEQKLIQAHKMESIGRIAGGVAHDINNVLAVILPTAQMIGQEAGVNPKIREYSEVIFNSAQRSADIVKQLLVYSRQTPTRMSWLNLNDTVADILKMLSRLLEKNIVIETELQEQLPFVEADSTQLHQVLLNLAVNARDAMPDGGTLRIATRFMTMEGPLAQRVDLPEGLYVNLSVQDNGAGIARHELPKIFEAFYSSKQAGYGTGLGLAVVRSIVTGHRGAVDVESEPGRGTRFDVYIPVSRRQPPAQSAMVKRLQPAGNATILLVDDESDILDMCKSVLERLGYVVHAASSGEHAVRLFGIHAFDLVVLDIQMPGMDGVDLLEMLLRIKPDTRYMFFTGYIKPERKHYLETKFKPLILQKPFTMEALANSIHHLLKNGTGLKEEQNALHPHR